MKLLLRRNQKSGVMRGVSFTLDARAQLTPEERNNVERYRLGGTMLYQRNEIADRGAGLLGMGLAVRIQDDEHPSDCRQLGRRRTLRLQRHRGDACR